MLDFFEKYPDGARDKVLIAIYSESIIPDLNIFDYIICGQAVNFSYLFKDRLGLLYSHAEDVRDEFKQKRNISIVPSKFCNFIYGHQGNEMRDILFDMFYSYKPVDSFGAYRNNQGELEGEKTRYKKEFFAHSIELKKGYKFSIACENSSTRGYISEKILSSFYANTIPIYWGDPYVADIFNKDAFINTHDYDSLDELLKKVIEIDNNDALWLEMVNQPILNKEYMNSREVINRKEIFGDFLYRIFSGSYKENNKKLSGYHFDYIKKYYHVGISQEIENIKERYRLKINGYKDKMDGYENNRWVIFSRLSKRKKIIYIIRLLARKIFKV